MQRTVGSYRATPHPATKESPDVLMYDRELRWKLPERIVPAGEIPYDPIRQRDAAKKRVSMGWWLLRLSAKILALLRLSVNFLQLRLTKKLKINFFCFKK